MPRRDNEVKIPRIDITIEKSTIGEYNPNKLNSVHNRHDYYTLAVKNKGDNSAAASSCQDKWEVKIPISISKR